MDRKQLDALVAEFKTWTAEEQAEVLEAFKEPAETKSVVLNAVVQAIRRRRAASAPLPMDELALAIRERISPRDLVSIARNLLAESKTDADRRRAQAFLDDLRARGFPMDDA
jgi:hypothetical protein